MSLDGLGIVNINVQKKFLKLWYKKKKITLEDISLTKKEGPKGLAEEVLVGKQIPIPNDTSNEESRIESEEDFT